MSYVFVLLMTIDIVVDLIVGGAPAFFYIQGVRVTRNIPESVIIVALVCLYL
jgi:hypothetical protein